MTAGMMWAGTRKAAPSAPEPLSHLLAHVANPQVQHGGAAPRIHSIDDYFMQEKESVLVEKGVRRKVRSRAAPLSPLKGWERSCPARGRR